MAHKVISVDLGQANTLPGLMVAERNKDVAEITWHNVPDGAIFSLVLGSAGDPLPYDKANAGWRFCPPERQGAFIYVPSAQVGARITLVISYADGPGVVE